MAPSGSDDWRIRNERSGGKPVASDRSGADLTTNDRSYPAHPAPSEATQLVNSAGSHAVFQGPEIISNPDNELAQKDEVIAALVHELEQAVEQLDRFRRTGTDRSVENRSNPPLGQFAPSTDLRSSMTDDLRRMAEQWDELQPAAVLSRIESQLESVYDLVSKMGTGDRHGPGVDHAHESRGRRMDVEPDMTIDADQNDMTIVESPSSWEAIKQQILGGEAPAVEDCRDSEDQEVLTLMSRTPCPQVVDLTTADIETLKSAIIERDVYIVQLNRFSRMRLGVQLPADWATLANVPSEMQVRVETLLERLDVQVRLGEVEMSIERARLARERSQIQSEREHVEKHLRRLGLNSIADLDNISAAPGTASDRRWMRFLGTGSK